MKKGNLLLIYLSAKNYPLFDYTILRAQIEIQRENERERERESNVISEISEMDQLR